MALDMTPDQKETGKGNFNRVVGKLADADQQTHAQQGVTRRRFMQGLVAAGATVPVSAAAFFGYRSHGFPGTMAPVKAALIGCGDEGGVLVGEHNPNFVKFIACCDVRPSNRDRIFENEQIRNPASPRRGFKYHYGSDAKRHIRFYDDYRELLQNSEIELVVIALPLHLHAPVAIAAMEAGKHVLCEKLMAWNVTQCKQMIRTAQRTGKLLSIGHQRHYSMLYAHANEVVASGVLGDVRHIRAQWHRNNVRPNPTEATRRERPLLDSWWPLIPAADRAALTAARLRELDYENIEELVRWRLFNRTGGGLMAELGSHQLDACSIFLNKERPLSVTAVGGSHFYNQHGMPREVEDHVYCIYEFPGLRFDRSRRNSRDNDIVTVTYSSINTNGFEPYGECVMGSKATLVVSAEQDAYLWGVQGRSTDVTASTAGNRPVIDASSSTAPVERQAAATGQNALGHNPPSRGYREEMEHLAYCIRMLGPNPSPEERALYKPRCDGKAAMADAIIALTANQAMKNRTRIEFRDAWFEVNDDPARDRHEVPDADMVERRARAT
ncbi:MAG: Gfo/Idh/MocA family oxidoreductase [Planctomycetes bacterium]|nr:Gfo/Idh/MocA family oxidoreductase [Planctomycetota bacterium]